MGTEKEGVNIGNQRHILSRLIPKLHRSGYASTDVRTIAAMV